MLLAGAALIVLGLAGWIVLTPEPVPLAAAVVPATPAVAPAAVPAPARSLAAPLAGPAEPSFDVVRVGPQGSAVIAGRAEPGAQVVVRDGTTEIARTQADRQGAFVAIPAAPLAEGGRSLTLTARGPGGAERTGDGAVVVVVPPAAPPAHAQTPAGAPAVAPAVAVLVPRSGPSRVLQTDRGPAGGVELDTVDYDDKGGIRFSGRAGAGSTARVYVDNRAVGDVAADAEGRWALAPGEAVAPGLHRLRVDRLDAAGRVTARVELPFQRASVPAAELAAGRMVVQPGQNLWRMARAAYGSGVRYTVIYLANRDSIRDPRLIYPGQAFAVPGPR